MKKLMNYGALLLIGGALVTSCGKTTKGKLSGEWNLDSWERTDTYSQGSYNSETEFMITGTDVEIVQTVNGDVETKTGEVDEASWTINKDGTWDRVLEYTTTEVDEDQIFGQTYTYTTVRNTRTTESGTWTFLSGIEDDYKKNERVVFHTTMSEEEVKTDVTTDDGSSSTTTSSNESTESTYLTGEMSEIFKVSESSRKELILTSEGESEVTDTDDNGDVTVTKSSYNASVTLSQE